MPGQTGLEPRQVSPGFLHQKKVGEKMPVLVDNLSFRARSISKDFLIKILGLEKLCDVWQEGSKIANNYNRSIHYGGIVIGYDGVAGFSCYVSMSGQGCRTWEDMTTLEPGERGKWMTLFEYLVQEPDNYHFSRIDLAYDDYTNALNLERIDMHRRKKRYVTKTQRFDVNMGTAEIAYIGSNQSDTMLRIYNKKLERGYAPEDNFDYEHWYRAELQMRDEVATACVDALVTYDDILQVFFGKLYDFIRFTTKPNNDSKHANRLNVSPWWRKFCQNYPRLKFFYEPGSEYNLSKLEKFCRVGAGSSIKTMIYAKGWSERDLYRFFTKDDIMLRPDQKELIRQKEFERGVNLLDSALYKVKKDEK